MHAFDYSTRTKVEGSVYATTQVNIAEAFTRHEIAAGLPISIVLFLDYWCCLGRLKFGRV